jgi:imidazolonepropionase-like amidohydrolase
MNPALALHFTVMTRMNWRLLHTFIAAGVAFTAPGLHQTPTAGVVVFRNARLVDGDGAVISARGTLRIENGRIAAVGLGGGGRARGGEQEIDLDGRTLMPGLVNAHGHVADTLGLQTGAAYYTDANLRAQLRRYAEYGVTTVVSLGGDAEAGFRLRDAGAAGGLDRARVFLAGPVITATTPAAAAADVDRVAAMQPDFIKIRVDDNLGATTKMPLEVARAVIDRAHHHKLKVAAHIFYLADAKALLAAGVDFIAHSIRDAPVDDELIRLLKARDVCVCPTLTRELSTFVYESEPAFFSDPFFLKHADAAVLATLRDPARQAQTRASKSAQRYKVALEVASANLKRLADAGVSLAFGTDTGPPARFQGYFEHLELELMAKAGLTPRAILAAATGTAARCLGLTQVGSIRPGRLADLLVVKDDPLADVRNLRAIESVWIGGVRLR